MMTINEKLLRLRKERGWSQEDAAGRLGISRQALSRWELGSAVPDGNNLLLLSRLYGVSTDYLLKDELESDPLLQPVIPAVSAKRSPLPIILYVLGGVLTVLALTGMLILGILSSVNPHYVNYATEVFGGTVIDHVVKTGLDAYLSVNNLYWLWNLCLFGCGAGILMLLHRPVLFPLGRLFKRIGRWFITE